jgi:hypothetical protein
MLNRWLTEQTEKATAEGNITTVNKMPRPRVMLVDLDTSVADCLAAKRFEVTVGSMGTRYAASADAAEVAIIDASLPALEEQDVVVIDASHPVAGEVDRAKHLRTETKAIEQRFVKPEGQGYFNPRPLTGFLYWESFRKIVNHGGILVILANRAYDEDYVAVKLQGNQPLPYSAENHTFSSLHFLPSDCNLTYVESRIDISVESLSETLKPLERILRRHVNSFQPESTIYVHRNQPHVPLLLDRFGETLGSMMLITQEDGESGIVLLLPPSKRPDELIHDLLTEALPPLRPQLFPDLTNSLWANSEPYLLPSIKASQQERQALTDEYEAKLADIEKEIERQEKDYEFLYRTISARGTGDALVDALRTLFEKIGFANVYSPDEGRDKNFEEDLQVELDEGLLVVEAKGLAGLPTEKDCQQVVKYVARRQKTEKNVHGLFVVNHQLHLPPLERRHPFTSAQIEDSRSYETYSLVSTWQLFNMYLAFERGELSLEDVVYCLRLPGLVDFLPKAWAAVGKVTHTYPQAGAVRIELDIGKLSVGDTVGFLVENRYLLEAITSIQIDKEPVHSGQPGQALGVKLKNEVPSGTVVYSVDSTLDTNKYA